MWSFQDFDQQILNPYPLFTHLTIGREKGSEPIHP
jgi:hypothetical protein